LVNQPLDDIVFVYYPCKILRLLKIRNIDQFPLSVIWNMIRKIPRL